MIPIQAKYTKEQADIMIEKKRSIQDLHPDLAKKIVAKGKSIWTLRDLENWNDPSFRHRILGAYAAIEDWKRK